MKKHKLLVMAIMLLTFFFHTAKDVSAVDLITNGSFETGNFSGWTATNPASAWRLWAVSSSGAGGDDGSGYSPVPTATVVQHGTRSAWNGVTAGAGQSYILFQQVTLPAGQTASIQWIDRYQMNHTQFCSTGCGTAQYFVEITNTSNVVLQTLYSVTTPTNSNSNTGYVTHYALLGTAYAGQTIRIRFRTLVQNGLQGPGQVEIDNVRLNAPAVLNPNAAEVSVGGQIKSANGNGINNVAVSLTETNGTTRTVKTNAFGYYNFEGIEVGQTVTLTVNSKRYTFANPTRIVSVAENVGDVDWTSIE